MTGLFVRGVLSGASLIEFITVFGIAPRNGIMLVLHIHHEHEKRDRLPRSHPFRGAMEQLAPVPDDRAYCKSGKIPNKIGDHISCHSIATVIVFEMLTSMLLNMVIVSTHRIWVSDGL